MAITFGKKKSTVGRKWTTLKVHDTDIVIPPGGLTTQIQGIETPQTITNSRDLLKELKAPEKKENSIKLNITRFYTDLNGNVIDKNLVPQALKTKFPFYMFGEQDFNGGFKAGNQANPPIASVFFQKYIAGEGFDWFALQGGDIWANYQLGDMVLIFADSYPNMNHLIFIVVSCDQQAYGSILKDTYKGNLDLTEILYITDNKLQYNERISFFQLNNLSVPKIDYYQPFAAFTPEQKQAEFISIPMSFKILPKIGLGSYFQFDTNFISFEFKVKHY